MGMVIVFDSTGAGLLSCLAVSSLVSSRVVWNCLTMTAMHCAALQWLAGVRVRVADLGGRGNVRVNLRSRSSER